MALTKVQQEVWAKTIVAGLEEKTIASRICNTNLVASAGLQADKWHIIAATDPTTANVDDSGSITYNALTDTSTEVTANFDKVAAVVSLDTDKVSTALNYEQIYMEKMSYKLSSDLDTGVFGLYTAAGTDFFESGSTAWQFTKDTCADIPGFFGKLSKLAKDNDWPDEGRFIVGPSGFGEAIYTYAGGRASTLGDDILKGGVAGFPFCGFQVFISNRLTTAASVTHGIAGVMGDGIALGTQVNPNQIEMMRAEGKFADLYRARLRAGYKVYRSETVIDVNFNETVVATS